MYLYIELFLIYRVLDLLSTCPILKAQCAETGGKCNLDENEVVQCVCPDGTEYINDIGCTGEALNILLKSINFKICVFYFQFAESKLV